MPAQICNDPQEKTFEDFALGDVVITRGRTVDIAAGPPVVFMRVVLPVVEAPFRRGLALSHMPMLTPTCDVVANQELPLVFCPS